MKLIHLLTVPGLLVFGASLAAADGGFAGTYLACASCGPIPIARDIVKAGAAHHFGFVIRPLGAKADAAELARVSASETADSPGLFSLSADTFFFKNADMTFCSSSSGKGAQ